MLIVELLDIGARCRVGIIILLLVPTNIIYTIRNNEEQFALPFDVKCSQSFDPSQCKYLNFVFNDIFDRLKRTITAGSWKSKMKNSSLYNNMFDIKGHNGYAEMPHTKIENRRGSYYHHGISNTSRKWHDYPTELNGLFVSDRESKKPYILHKGGVKILMDVSLNNFPTSIIIYINNTSYKRINLLY